MKCDAAEILALAVCLRQQSASFYSTTLLEKYSNVWWFWPYFRNFLSCHSFHAIFITAKQNNQLCPNFRAAI